MKNTTRRRRLLTVLAVALVAAPAAQAGSYAPAYPDDLRYPGEGITAPSIQGAGLNEFGIPSDLKVPGGGFVSAVPDAAMPANVTYPGEGIQAPLPQAVTVSVPRADGFDFADAGVGAGVALGAALLLAAAAMASRRHRRLVHM